MSIEEHRFESAQEAGAALAQAVAADLRTGILRRGAASLAISPRPGLAGFCEALRAQALDWSRVQITLTDEAWVAPGSAHSGEHLLRRQLLQDAALDARLVGLWTPDSTPIMAAPQVAERLLLLPRPFDAVVLEPGAEGQVAALFPGMPALEAMLNPNWAVPAAPARAPDETFERITLTLRSLLDASRIYLFAAGEDAEAGYAAALQAGARSPLRALLAQNRTPVEVFLIEDESAA